MTKELDNEKKLALANNGIADASATTVDNLGLGAIYTMFFTPFLHHFLETIGKYFLYPISILAHAIKTILAWRQVYLDGGNSRSVLSAVIETAGTAAITAAVVGSLVASAVFALATPLLFTITMAGKTLFQAVSAIFYGVKAYREPDPIKKQEYKTLAINNAIGTLAGMIATAAVVSVFLLGKGALAAIGFVGAVIGVSLAVYKGYKMFKGAQAAKKTSVAAHTDETAEKTMGTPELRRRLLEHRQDLSDAKLSDNKGVDVVDAEILSAASGVTSFPDIKGGGFASSGESLFSKPTAIEAPAMGQQPVQNFG